MTNKFTNNIEVLRYHVVFFGFVSLVLMPFFPVDVGIMPLYAYHLKKCATNCKVNVMWQNHLDINSRKTSDEDGDVGDDTGADSDDHNDYLSDIFWVGEYVHCVCNMSVPYSGAMGRVEASLSYKRIPAK